MSQHLFKAPSSKNGEMLTIFLGYDRPLNYLFLNIEPSEPSVDSDHSLHYDSMDDADLKRGGFESMDALFSKLAQYVDRPQWPRPLHIALTEDIALDNRFANDKRIRNKRWYWPLEGALHTSYEIAADMDLIQQELRRDDVSDDEELNDLLHGQLTMLKNRSTLGRIIKEQRDQCRLEPLYLIPWEKYEGDVFA